MASADDMNRNRQEVRRLIAGVDDELASTLLRGAVDLHVHSGPSTMPRKLDHMEAAEEAAAAGMRGLLFKDHHYSVAPVIPMMERLLGDRGLSMFSGLVLNNSTGGLNPFVVDAQLKMGAKLIWMPTAQAANHIRSAHRKTRLASNVQLRHSPALTPVDAYGNILDEVKQILDMIAEFDVILSSGHLHVWEIWKLFDEARARGVKRLLVNHPMYGLHFTPDDVRELAQLGAVIEQSAGLYVDSRFNTYTPEEFKEHIMAAGVEHSSIGSDLGQIDNPTPVEGMRQAIKLCLALGFSETDVRTMVADNPAKLVGLAT
ncbi:DUF6282 family protein [Neorhizobium galegae]|uniref:DUF6282 family protein n=1 Tax=Neorhizobium galegae TaxID=399 RepID=UPI0006219AC9|nr:DUF6282 family protein [Neorhizobium galegae]MCQ1767845.1 DUF6282 family protein [Neorhizobium galegae]MCQ1848184.1 DUF6282 family protein [Neorhizobium galegae]CDZ26876.1 Hypothetical protein NGAL_HAMBI490_17150 [Neorhizobium galegae bv. officinalis]CDZ37005.1 Hypothetical protein NGAL_HAMBI1146_21560 [Neorhizobium galegae bv. officinalis]